MSPSIFVFSFVGFTITLFSVKTSEIQKAFPSNWKDYIDPIILNKYQGKSQLGFNDKDYFQGDIRGVDKNIPTEDFKRGFNNVIADKNKRWISKKKSL